MNAKPLRRAALALLVMLGLSSPLLASVIPSKAEEPAAAQAREADLVQIKDLLARSEVARALAAQGLPSEAVEQRLEKLSTDDLRSLASNIEQIQAAGDVPKYIWILLGILLAVSILAAVF